MPDAEKDADPVCVCGENFSRHTYEHTFVDAEHYGTTDVLPPGEGRG